MFRSLGAPEIIAILVVVLLLFGAKRMPDAARGLGRSLRIFKSEVKAMGDDDAAATPKPAPSATPVESAPAEPGKPDPAER